jgi:hypothetical protein
VDNILGTVAKSHTKRQTDAKASGPVEYSFLLPVCFQNLLVEATLQACIRWLRGMLHTFTLLRPASAMVDELFLILKEVPLLVTTCLVS